MIAPVSTTALVQAVAASSAAFGAMAAGQTWQLSVTAATWVKQGAATPVASAANGSFLIQPGEPCLLDGALGAQVAVIQASVAGIASLVRVKQQRPL